MNACWRYLLAALVMLPLLAPPVLAQTGAPAPAPKFTQAELDQMLAPIALYPDALLSQILIAATYPLEVVQAARWSKANSGLQGEAAVRAVDDRDWDPSVKSLAAFPQILAMMDEKLEWTERLGDAFLAQPEQVMDTAQSLRQKAYAAGNLQSSEHQRVEYQPQSIVIVSAYPDVFYVPYYDPLVVYGPWWWPAYRPVYWAPWPGYYVRPGVVFYWSVGIRIGHGFFFGSCDWQRRHVRIVHVHPFYYHRVHRPLPVHTVWVHEPDHRRGVPYRHPDVQAKYARVNAPPLRRDVAERGRYPSETRREQGAAARDKPPSSGVPGRRIEKPTERRDEERRALPRNNAGDGDRSPPSGDNRGRREAGGKGGELNVSPGRVGQEPDARVDRDGGGRRGEGNDRGPHR